MNLIYSIWESYGIPAVVVALLAFVLTYAAKIPYKMLTGLIKDDDFRHLANVPIAFIPIGIAIGLWYLYCYLFTAIGPWEQMLLAGVLCGASAIIMYFAFGARIEAALKKAIRNKRLGTAICSTDDEKADLAEIANTVKDAANPVDAIKKLFCGRLKRAAKVKDIDSLDDIIDKYLTS